MDESSSSAVKIPSRIVLSSPSLIPLSQRFSSLRQVAVSAQEQRKMAGPRDPRNFLYDDYYEPEADDRSEDYEAPRGRGGRDAGRSTGDRGGRPLRRYEDDDMDVEYERPERGRRAEAGGARGSERTTRRPVYERPVERPTERATAGGGGRQARRFADAMGIPASRGLYADEEDYGVPSRPRVQRALYRDPPIARVAPVRRQVIRRRYDDDYDDEDVDLPRGARVVEVVERVRRVPIVKKIPIRQRVVKKIIVQKVGNVGNRRRSNADRNENNDRARRVQKSGVQKKKATGGGGGGGGAGPSGAGGAKGGRFKNQKPKMSASELDRELEEYMRGSKHPRVTT
ncbi:hypothetical protein M3Y99_00236700 [Aphelenchoides fujianensis]|nr:hypothetical protein M3Y99_00236700 [Aphelenchoides fujianensis]